MRKAIVFVIILVVVGAAAAKVTQTIRGRAAYRACRYYVALDEDRDRYPDSYYRPECLRHPSDYRWRETDVAQDFYAHPYSVESHGEQEPSWHVVAVGDIMAPADLQLGAYFHRNDPGETSGGYDWVLAGVRDLVENADLAIGNLETPVAPSIPRAGLWHFNVDPMYLDAMKNIGFDALMTANNHALDYGVKGIKETQEELRKRGFASLGISMPGEERQRYMIIEAGDTSIVRIAILNYTLEMNPIRFWRSYRYLNYLVRGRCVNWFDMSRPRGTREKVFRWGRNTVFFDALYTNRDTFLQSVGESIALARSKGGADYVIVFLQWGEAYRVMPGLGQRELAIEMCLRGADAIIGAGPHVIQPMERIYTMGGEVVERQDGAREHFVAYSLGNLVSHHRGIARYGMLIDMKLARSADGVYLQSVDPYIVESISEPTTVALADGGTAPVNTYYTQLVDMSEFLDIAHP